MTGKLPESPNRSFLLFYPSLINLFLWLSVNIHLQTFKDEYSWLIIPTWESADEISNDDVSSEKEDESNNDNSGSDEEGASDSDSDEENSESESVQKEDIAAKNNADNPENDPNLSNLYQVFPNVDRSTINNMYMVCERHPERTYELLMNQGASEAPAPVNDQPPPTAQQPGPVPTARYDLFNLIFIKTKARETEEPWRVQTGNST